MGLSVPLPKEKIREEAQPRAGRPRPRGAGAGHPRPDGRSGGPRCAGALARHAPLDRRGRRRPAPAPPPRRARSRPARGRTSATRARSPTANWVFTGCISTDGRSSSTSTTSTTGQQRLLTLFRGLEVDDHNNPSLVFFRAQALRVRVRARRLRLPARPQQPDAVPRLQARLGRRARLGRHAHDPARLRLRARLHVPEPGRLGQAPVPLHARAVLVPVLHVDHRRQDLGARRGRSCSARRPRAATCARTPSTTTRRTARS